MKLVITLLIAGSVSLFAADAPFSSLTSLTSLAAGDLFAVTDISDTTQSANGTSKKITATSVGAFYTDDSIFSSAWNGITDKAPSENVVYDFLHLLDTDDDGKINSLDLAAAGFVAINSSGVLVASRTVAEGAAIDVTNGDGASGNPTVAFDSTEVEATTWGAGGNASNVWTFNLSGTDPVITLSSGVVNVSAGTLQQGGVDVLTSSGTQSPTNKTFDVANNILKFKSFPQFTSPLRTDGTNCTIGSTVTAVGYGLATFSNSVDEASNWCEWRIVVPADWDTTVDPRVKLVDMIGADTSTRQYSFQVATVATSAAAAATVGTKIDVNLSADGSGASGDVAISSTTTLTGWGAAVTPGQMMVIRVARDGDDASDGSTIGSTLIAFELEYGVTQ